jgi:hypothetical protein
VGPRRAEKSNLLQSVGRNRFSSSEDSTTETEDMAIMSPARAGGRRIMSAGYSTPAAMGMHSRLYTKEKTRFTRMRVRAARDSSNSVATSKGSLCGCVISRRAQQGPAPHAL